VLGELVKQLAVQRAIGSADPEALSELTRISSEILRAFPGVPKPVEWSPELTPLRIADAILKTVGASAADSPILLVIDDLHAADNASTAILHSLARKLVNTRVMMILAGRTSELRLSGAPWALTSDHSIDSLRTLELEVLPVESAQHLISRLTVVSSKADPPVDRILRASGRNPLAIELITREWAEHGDASLLRDLEALDTQPAPVIGIPRAIAAVFDRQSRRLDITIRATLDLAAVLGRRLTEVSLYSAIDLTPGQAAEALSRLRDEGYLREVSGDLEFRNELIRAEAYYAVAGSTRQFLHRRVAELLVNNHLGDDKAVSLEIAWHHLKGGDIARAVPFALEGSEAVLAVGAPHGAEEILRAITHLKHQSKTVRLLLAKALVDQSKVEPALPIIEELSSEPGLTDQERAMVSLLRASAEFLLNRDHGNKYGEVAKVALEAAQRSGDVDLIAKALFECARAGSEEGITELIEAAEAGIEELKDTTDIATLPMATVTKAFCRFYLTDPRGALQHLHMVAQRGSTTTNAAQLAFVYSGIGIANHFLCQMELACDAFKKALEYARKVGDDTRVSQIAANLCTLYMNRGDYEQSIRFGEMGLRFGEASSSTSLLTTYTNLMDPYILTGREEAAMQCLEKARQWLASGRRWKLRCAFLVEAASFALVQRNNALALDLIAQLDTLAKGRENAVPMPGPFWKLKIFREFHRGNEEEAHRIIAEFSTPWRKRCPFHYLDILAARAWLERQLGQFSEQTESELKLFDRFGANGRRALFTMQGFLTPAPASNRSPSLFPSDQTLTSHPPAPRATP